MVDAAAAFGEEIKGGDRPFLSRYFQKPLQAAMQNAAGAGFRPAS